jgi:dihydropteroate synthase
MTRARPGTAAEQLVGRVPPLAVPGVSVEQPTVVMGVVNVTPDSFSDGGKLPTAAAAVEHGLWLRDQGAAIIDVGGESTRPGARRPSQDEELRRVRTVVADLAAAGVVVSIDTMRAAVAAAALEVGASLVNDVSGGLADPELLDVVARSGVPVVLSHWRGHSATMQQHAVYDDVIADVLAALQGRLAAATAAGVAPERVALDPGLGFGKRPEHNWALLGALDQLHGLGRPLLLGASRKSFLGELLAGSAGPRPVEEREAATTAVTTLAAAAGVWCVRTHAVRDSVDAVRVAGAWAPRRVPGEVVVAHPVAEHRQAATSPSQARVSDMQTEASAVDDRIVVSGITATGHHGWLAEERATGQRFVVDVALSVDASTGASSDELDDTVDYADIASAVTRVVEGPPVNLIERLAEQIAAECLRRAGVAAVEVTVHKPEAPIPVPFEDVTVTIRRNRP